MASVGPDKMLFVATIFIDGFTAAWAAFFILTALMVIPSLIFLRLIRDDIHRLEQR
jgi:PAT family beta-lactamase induction signal transducer AmpG